MMTGKLAVASRVRAALECEMAHQSGPRATPSHSGWLSHSKSIRTRYQPLMHFTYSLMISMEDGAGKASPASTCIALKIPQGTMQPEQQPLRFSLIAVCSAPSKPAPIS